MSPESIQYWLKQGQTADSTEPVAPANFSIDDAMEAVQLIVGEDTDVLLSDEGAARVYRVLEQIQQPVAPFPPIKGAWIDGGYVIVTPAGSGNAPALKTAILAAAAAAAALAAQPETQPASEVEQLRKALVYAAMGLHGARQHMLIKGITLHDGDRVSVKLGSMDVDTGHIDVGDLFDAGRAENVYAFLTSAQPAPPQSPSASGNVGEEK